MNARQFFYEQAGYAWDPATETREQGRQRCAESLAQAETWAESVGLTYSWEFDELPWDGDGPAPDELLCCIARWRDGTVAASLGAIGDPSREYARVVEAELAQEAREEMLASVFAAI